MIAELHFYIFKKKRKNLPDEDDTIINELELIDLTKTKIKNKCICKHIFLLTYYECIILREKENVNVI